MAISTGGQVYTRCFPSSFTSAMALSNVQVDDTVAFEHPLDVHYTCASFVGWPKLLVSVWQQDEYGRHEIG